MSGTSKIAAERNSKAVIDLVMKPGNGEQYILIVQYMWNASTRAVFTRT